MSVQSAATIECDVCDSPPGASSTAKRAVCCRAKRLSIDMVVLCVADGPWLLSCVVSVWVSVRVCA